MRCHRLPPPNLARKTRSMSSPIQADAPPLREALQTACMRFGGGEVQDLRRLSGGASQEIWAFDLRQPSQMLPLILRRAPAGDRGDTEANSLRLEATLLDHVARAGVPVPAPRLVLEPGDGLGEGYLMDRISGETLPPRIMRKSEFARARESFSTQAGHILATIHATPCEEIALPEASALEMVQKLDERYRATGTARPVFELALRWLNDNLPRPRAPRLVHGDFRNGNLMFGPEGIRAVLDWELAHKGDPLEDLGWLMVRSWRFGALDLPAGGLGKLEPLIEAYEALAGPIDRAELRFWEIYGTLRWGVMCASMVAWVEQGIDRTPERAMIARRASETELDLATLLYPGYAHA